jgi:hypothetical protein
MENEAISTKPKPFVFVLMPFEPGFRDIYEFGIKGAAADVGAYAERLDEQIFTEGILERIFNQINKADVVVADMTGRNPNVFYEVGYAHALGKIVLLLTQSADDIPFDLKHHQHIVYEGSIETLRVVLAQRLKWAINEARSNQRGSATEFEVNVNDVRVLSDPSSEEPPVVVRIAAGPINSISLVVRNVSSEMSEPISHVYLFAGENSALTLYQSSEWGSIQMEHIQAHPSDSVDGLIHLYQIPGRIPALPSQTFATIKFAMSINLGVDEEVRLRLHTSHRSYSYRFKVASQH